MIAADYQMRNMHKLTDTETSELYRISIKKT